MVTDLRRKMDEHSEILKKEIENIRKFQAEATELKNTITEHEQQQKSSLELFDSRLDKTKI